MPLWLLFPFDYACAAMSSFIPAIRPFATPAVAAATQADARDSTGQSAAHSFPGYLFKAPRGSAAQYDQVSQGNFLSTYPLAVKFSLYGF